MQTLELMAIFQAYAANLGPVPDPEYKVLHPHVHVPQDHLPIRVVQFHRGQRSNGENRLYHWAIHIPTSTRRGVGNFYEIGGSLQTRYVTQHLTHTRHPMWNDERGSHLVGYVAPSYVGSLETHLSLVSIVQGSADWHCQRWVVEALQGLHHPHLFAVQMEYAQWAQQMKILDKAWEVGDA